MQNLKRTKTEKTSKQENASQHNIIIISLYQKKITMKQQNHNNNKTIKNRSW